MAPSDLAEKHLADLHDLAAELEVPGYRLLRRDDLIAEIEARGGGPEVTEDAGPAEVESDEDRDEDRELEDENGDRTQGDEPTEVVTGVLEITRRRYGFLRLAGEEPSEDDVYLSASQIRRCELKPGDEVTGPARDPRPGEKHRALVHVDLVNGEPPPTVDEPEDSGDDLDD